MPRRLVFLPRFSRTGASSRYRCWQFLPACARAGLTPQVHPLFDDHYLQSRYRGRSAAVAHYLRAMAGRLTLLRQLPPDEPLWFERELLPLLPWPIEHLFLRRRRYVVSYDDVPIIWKRPWPRHAAKWRALVARAAWVEAGNPWLQQRMCEWNPQVLLWPTVLDPLGYEVKPAHELVDPPRVTVGWLGSPFPGRYLVRSLPALEAANRACPLRLSTMGLGRSLPTSFPHRDHPWSEASEKTFPARLDLGLMPLDDSPISRGKCGLKLLQYMAASLPAIASWTEANAAILDDGRVGRLVRSPTDLSEALIDMGSSPARRAGLGQAGRQRVLTDYDLGRAGPVQARRLLALATGADLPILVGGRPTCEGAGVAVSTDRH